MDYKLRQDVTEDDIFEYAKSIHQLDNTEVIKNSIEIRDEEIEIFIDLETRNVIFWGIEMDSFIEQLCEPQPPKREFSKDDKKFIAELKRCIGFVENGTGREIRESQQRLKVIIEKRQKDFNEAQKEDRAREKEKTNETIKV